jgi:signal transduction histidine kinase
MGQTEIILFIVLVSIILLVFIFGTIVFVLQYRRRKLVYEKEKALIEQQHRAEILNTQLKSQLQTMQFIGREIHDSVAQKLTLASIYSQKLEFENQVPGISPKLARISGIINDSLNELRDLSKTLTDNRIQDTDLTVLLRTECERVNETGVCKAILNSQFSQEISVTVKSFLLRIVQEFIQNSLKHAECNRITIELTSNADCLMLKATDDGKGFDSNNKDFKGIGLNNMKRRIHLIGGIFNLQSEPGKGTTLQLSIVKEKLLAE